MVPLSLSLRRRHVQRRALIRVWLAAMVHCYHMLEDTLYYAYAGYAITTPRPRYAAGMPSRMLTLSLRYAFSRDTRPHYYDY